MFFFSRAQILHWDRICQKRFWNFATFENLRCAPVCHHSICTNLFPTRVLSKKYDWLLPKIFYDFIGAVCMLPHVNLSRPTCGHTFCYDCLISRCLIKITLSRLQSSVYQTSAHLRLPNSQNYRQQGFSFGQYSFFYCNVSRLELNFEHSILYLYFN